MEKLSRNRGTYPKMSAKLPQNITQQKEKTCKKVRFSEVTLRIIPRASVKNLISSNSMVVRICRYFTKVLILQTWAKNTPKKLLWG